MPTVKTPTGKTMVFSSTPAGKKTAAAMEKSMQKAKHQKPMAPSKK